jgi:hypothetical protein
MRRLLLLLLLAFPALAEPLTVHVTVALCDNASQGIVPVPAAIGNGDDPRTNLYWGASLGVKSWLKREKWQVQSVPAKPPILERIVAKKTINGREVVLTADAWQGKRIREAITAFIEDANGIGPQADIVAYIGHDGLMEFNVAPRMGTRPRKAIVLACASRQYFGRYVPDPLLMTNGLMAPEAYTLTAAIEAHVKGTNVTEAAAQAYDRFQKCGIRAARNLFAQR